MAGDTRSVLRRALLAWYRRTARDLPWRRTRSPYRIWLSEILLQQTRVETVVPYYQRFVQAFPTVSELARVALGVEIAVGVPRATIQHAFTHRRLRVQVYACRLLRGQPRETDVVRWVAEARLADFALASVDRKLMRAALPANGSP